MSSSVVHWFRKGLRIHDNPALSEAILDCIDNNKVLRPIFILDPELPKSIRVSDNRWRFLQETLADLNKNLKTINSRLYVIRGNPKTVFPKLFKEWNVDLLTFEKDIEPYAVQRDTFVEELAKEYKVKVLQFHSHTIFDPNVILKKNAGQAPKTYQKFLSIATTCAAPNPLLVPEKLPDSCKPPKDKSEKSDIHCYDPPTLEEMGVNEKELNPVKFPGGETEALKRMEKHLLKSRWICEFEKPNTSPNSLEPSTTVLSPYLKFGCLSSRLFFKRVKDVYKLHNHSKPPVSLEGQLIWREFYYTAAAATPNFDKMVGNPACTQIPWEKNDKFLEAWKEGRTGYPWIDACMRQLKQEGWIHHLARHAVACFLTRGDLWVSWEDGQKVFEEYLLDADWALNAANWMWMSASAFFYQYYRVYSPVAFGKKTDPEGKFIKKYVPELKDYPSGIIYEPWKASLENQKKYGCIIGKDYPNRIVDHDKIHKINIGKMNAAYAKKKEAAGGAKNNDDDDPKANTSSSKSSNKRKATTKEANKLTKYLKKK